MVHLAVIGCGYVGGVSAACFAEMGHDVDCIDVDADRIGIYNTGRSPIFEPGLDPLIAKGLSSGRLRFMSQYPDSLDAEIVFIAVNTPGSQEGAADLRWVRDAVSSVSSRMRSNSIIVNKSTVPIGTGDLVEGMARRSGDNMISVVSNPEFLREGSAVRDFMHPDRIVLGSNDPYAVQRVAELYEPLGAPVQCVDIRTAEMIKYASNAFLATKISFINEIAAICESLGADVKEVARGMGMDSRIGGQFLSAGLGWGGSCFPKDVRALAHMAAVHGTHPQLLRSVIEINNDQRLRTVRKIRAAVGGALEGRRVLILGAAFKSNTDDIRNSPALELANLLAFEGSTVALYDPVVPAARITEQAPQVQVAASIEEGAIGAHAVVLATDWAEFLGFDFSTIRQVVASPIFVDARNCMDSESIRAAGFDYFCVGRPSLELAASTSQDILLAPLLSVGGGT